MKDRSKVAHINVSSQVPGGSAKEQDVLSLLTKEAPPVSLARAINLAYEDIACSTDVLFEAAEGGSRAARLALLELANFAVQKALLQTSVHTVDLPAISDSTQSAHR